MTVDASKITLTRMDEIYADPNFNCRGHISPISVVELSKDIDKHGLQQPIVVKPLKENEKHKPNHKWKVISGHRRYTAFVVLQREEIPCVINDEISDADALILNLGENLHRKDLNVMQEAKALERLKLSGFSVTEVCEQINKSATWVKIRFQLLELPEPIREAAAAGYINQNQIRDLHKLDDVRKQIEAAKKIKKAKQSGEKIPSIIKPKRSMFKAKERKADDILWMQTHIRESIGNNFGTRCLAWAAGEITDLDLFRDIRNIARRSDIIYEIPYHLDPIQKG
jgi:ParB family chromosome partitioning protein